MSAASLTGGPTPPSGASAGPAVRRAVLVALGTLAALGVLVAVASAAGAIGETVRMMPGSADTVEGRSVVMQVTAGVTVSGAIETTEVVRVTCDLCPRSYEAVVRVGDFGCSNGSCNVTFPDQFRVTPGPGQERSSMPPARSFGEPVHRDTYRVRITTAEGAQPETTFRTWLSSANSCRGGSATRSDVLLVQTAGHELGGTVRLEIRDMDRRITVMQQEFPALGVPSIRQILWEVPLDYPLGGDDEARFQVTVEGPKGREEETFVLRPAVADVFLFRQPGLRQEDSFSRTENVLMQLTYRFTAAPADCPDVAFNRRVVPVRAEDLPQGTLRARVDTLRNVQRGTPGVITEGPRSDGSFNAGINLWEINHTIPKDVEVTASTVAPDPARPNDPPREEDLTPRYRFALFEQRTSQGNVLPAFNSSSFTVHILTRSPVVAFRPDEVERLEAVRLVLNVTYADGTPATDADNRTALEIELREARPGGTVHTKNARYVGNGQWRVEFPLPFDYLPLGTYDLHTRGFEDRWGNVFEEITTGLFDVVGARPLLATTFLVGGEPVTSAERTQTVSVNVRAVYKNGVPLAAANVDPALGGVVLNVKKANAAGTVTSIQRLLMTPVDASGAWVKTFRIEPDNVQSPAGTWQIEVVARDGRDPPNENVTDFGLEVRPARLTVVTVESPPQLVREGAFAYRFRVLYPDRTPLTTTFADAARGAHLQAQLERLTFIRSIPVDLLDAVPVRGGDQWTVGRNATQLVEGTYVFNITGTDVYGNTVGPTVTRPFLVFFGAEIRAATDTLLRTYERGQSVFVVFPGLPGDTALSQAPGSHPTIQLLRRSVVDGAFEILDTDHRLGRDEAIALGLPDPGDNHVGVFRTTAATRLGDHMFFFQGRNADARTVVGVSTEFTLLPTTVTRGVLVPLPPVLAKGQQVVAVLERVPGDIVTQVSIVSGERVVGAGSGVGREDGNHIFVRPPASTPTGPVTIAVRGTDIYANPWRLTLGPVDVSAIGIRYEPRSQPAPSVSRNANVEHSFILRYADDSMLLNSAGTPSGRVLDARGEAVDNATVSFTQGTWVARWIPLPSAALGEYRFEIAGTDLASNPIGPFRSGPFQVTPGEVTMRIVRDARAASRGDAINVVFQAPTPLQEIRWGVGTESSRLGAPSIAQSGDQYSLVYRTARDTPLARVRFTGEGTDIYGNAVVARSGNIRLNPLVLVVQFTKNPGFTPEAGDTVLARFVVRYPDGTLMGPQFGFPIPTIAIGQATGGAIEASFSPDTSEWVVTWTTPNDPFPAPYRFVVGGQDRWSNVITPGGSTAFYILQPLVPDFFPTPPPGPPLLAAALMAAAWIQAALRRRP